MIDFSASRLGTAFKNSPGERPSSDRMRHAAEFVYRMMNLRDGIDANLFSDPAWNMLLDLYVSRDGPSLSVMDVCVGAKTSPATGVRYMRLLEEKGLVMRTADRNDKRRFYVELTEEGLRRIEAMIVKALDWYDSSDAPST